MWTASLSRNFLDGGITARANTRLMRKCHDSSATSVDVSFKISRMNRFDSALLFPPLFSLEEGAKPLPKCTWKKCVCVCVCTQTRVTIPPKANDLGAVWSGGEATRPVIQSHRDREVAILSARIGRTALPGFGVDFPLFSYMAMAVRRGGPGQLVIKPNDSLACGMRIGSERHVLMG